MKTKLKFVLPICILSTLIYLSCSKVKHLDLDQTNIRLVNRVYEATPNGESNCISMDAQESSGLAILNHITFEKGVIELDILGEDNPGKSFVGLAFNIQNDSTYEAVYFRPFNFHSTEQIRRDHGMQYIFHPDYPWFKLRKDREGQFESVFTNPPSPDDWFRVRIIIHPDQIIVEDPRSGKQLMQCERLTKPKSDKIGFWTGFGSKGSFKKLQVKK